MRELLVHINRYTPLTNDEAILVCTFFEEIHLKKKAHLHKVGALCKYNYFVLDGCLRLYTLTAKGNEQTTQFALENWWLTDVFAFDAQQPADSAIQAVEPSTVLRISKSNQEQLLFTVPKMERYFRLMYQKAFGAVQRRNMLHADASKEEIYQNFVNSFPDFIQRVPQYLLASYLGFTPEYLSELRRKSFS